MSAPPAVKASPAADPDREGASSSPCDETCQAPPPPPPPPPPRDDLLAPGRRLAVVSTAAPPWMTGTAVNPTLRAAFLAKELGCKRDDGEKEASPPPPPSSSASSSSSPSPSRPPRVTLVVPWLNKTDQGSLFPEGLLFDSPREQEVCLRSWVEARAGFEPQFELLWYPARYDRTLLGVFPVGDLAARVRDELCGPTESETEEETGKAGANEEDEEATESRKGAEATKSKPPAVLSRAASSFSSLLLSRSPSRAALQRSRSFQNTLLDGIILEEPEHLTWHHTGSRWTAVAPWVVGVVHTNYRELGGRNAGPVMGALAGALARWLAASHCHALVRLSPATALLPRQATACVHGVAPKFAEVGRRVAEERRRLNNESGREKEGTGAADADGEENGPNSRRCFPFTKGAYALGKVVWGKGWEELVELMGSVASDEGGEKGEGEGREGNTTAPLSVDAFGDGAALGAVVEAAALARARIRFHPKTDHLHAQLLPYRAFVNASTSDVVATTSLEALAMGKWLVCARHPCNEFAASFRNCLVYDDAAGFAANLRRALAEEPHPLGEEELEELGWAAATRRLGEAARKGADREERGRGGSPSGDGSGGLKGSASSSSSSLKRRSSSHGSSSRHFHHHYHHHHHHHHVRVVDKSKLDGDESEEEEEEREKLVALEAALTSVSVDDGDDAGLMMTKARLSAAANALAEAAFARAYAALLRVEPLRVAVGAGARTTEQHAHASISRKDGITYSPPEGADAQAGGGGSALGAFFAAAVAARPQLGGGFSCSPLFRMEWGERPCGFDWRWR